MRPISEIRKTNLIYLIETRFGGKQVAAADAIGVLPNLISRWVGQKGIGSNAARKIEKKLGLDDYWLDNDRDSVVPPQVDLEIGDIVARNLRGMMSSTPALNTQMRLQKASGVSQSTIQRVLNKDIDPTISSVHGIAQAFKRNGYELMMPENDPRQIPYDRDAYEALPNEEKAKIASFVEFVLMQNKKDSVE